MYTKCKTRSEIIYEPKNHFWDEDAVKLLYEKDRIALSPQSKCGFTLMYHYELKRSVVAVLILHEDGLLKLDLEKGSPKEFVTMEAYSAIYGSVELFKNELINTIADKVNSELERKAVKEA